MNHELASVVDVVMHPAKNQSKGSSNCCTVMYFKPYSIKEYLSQKSSKKKNDEEDEDEDKHGDIVCGPCGENYSSSSDEFWICCCGCEEWFHAKCVKITPPKAANITQYKCPICSNKRSASYSSLGICSSLGYNLISSLENCSID